MNGTQMVVMMLLNGSKYIDRMRIEINEVVRMVLGFALQPGSCPALTSFDEIFESDSCYWRLQGSTAKNGGGFFVAECFVKEQGEKLLLYSSTNRNDEIRLERVQFIYEALPIFVDGMIRKFPDLSKQLQPLYRASKPNKPAKDFVHEFSEIGRHDDFGNRFSFMSLIFAGVNDSASLNELQQNFCAKRMSEAWQEVREKSEGDKARAAMDIATYINSCHA